MGKNRISLVLGLVSALAVIGWTVYTTNPSVVDEGAVGCMDAFPNHVFVSEQHCMDEVEKCQEEVKISPTNLINLEGCFDRHQILRK